MTNLSDYSEIKTDTNRRLNYNTNEHKCEYKYTEFYVNESNTPVTLVNINDVPVTIKGADDERVITGKFILRRIYYFISNSYIKDVLLSLRQCVDEVTDDNIDLEIIKNSLEEKIKDNKFINQVSIVVDKVIKIEDIKINKCVYMKDSNLLVYLGGYNKKIFHPLRTSSIDREFFNTLAKKKITTGVFFEIIDNKDKINKRYAVFGGKIIKIPKTKDLGKKDGCYVTRVRVTKNGKVELDTSRVKPKNIKEELRICSTIEEAKEFYSGENNKRNNVKLKHKFDKELIKERANLEQKKIDYKKKEKELKEHIVELKHTAAMNDVMYKRKIYETKEHNEYASSDRKRFYEERSYDRKESHEFTKWVPLALTAVTTGLLFFKK